MDLVKQSAVYCVGLGGVGVSAIAKYLLSHGVRVAGSDPIASPLTRDVEALGGKHFVEVDPKRIEAYSAVVYSAACPPDHTELEAARDAGIPLYSFAEALGQIMQPAVTRIAISGTNGKSTTAGLTGLLLLDAGLDPTVFVGSRVTNFNGNLRLGRDELFVAEADEYRNHFHQLKPTILTVTNVEADHLDFFETERGVEKSFGHMVEQLSDQGVLVVNADDDGAMKLISHARSVVRVGFNPSSDFLVSGYRAEAGKQLFRASWQRKSLGEFSIPLPGKFNVSNAAAAMATALTAGADPKTFQTTLASFKGVWRRFEVLNPGAEITVVNDYAHHPTAVKETIIGAKSFYPGRRIIAVFQPHHQHRLKTFFEGFATALREADTVIVSDVYEVLGREEVVTKSSRDLVQAVQDNGTQAIHAASPEQAAATVQSQAKRGDVILIMGAGDIWTIGETLSKGYAA